jgi:excinuclease ABC subunit C
LKNFSTPDPPIPLSSIPTGPGVYRFSDKDEKIIYIGKAKNLKKRVSSYFQKSYSPGNKVSKLVRQIKKIDFSVVESETDALLLENNLIKKYQPKYNALLKDGKTFPFVFVTKEPFSRLFKLRNKSKQRGEYFGPYTSVKAQKLLVEFLLKLFKIRTCSLPLNKANIDSGKFKVCLEYHLGNCLGPCEDLQSEADYQEKISQAKYILKGKWGDVKKYFQARIKEASGKLEYEKAQEFKTYYEKLENFRTKSLVTNLTHERHELITVLKEGGKYYCNNMKVAEGSIVRTKNFIIQNPLDLQTTEILKIAKEHIQSEEGEIFEEILTNIEVLENESESWTVPKRGEKKKLVDLSVKNSKEFYLSRLKVENPVRINPGLLDLKEALGLSSLPKRIECFDNSNIQGANPVASMVCFINGLPAKKEYRHFNIKTVIGPDDFESMREVVRRRYKRVKEEKSEFPDLIVIDGGKGQLNAALLSLKELGLNIQTIGIAKRLEEIYRPEDPFPLLFAKNSQGLKVIQKLRNEAHRFAIEHHRNQRSKEFLRRDILRIKGIGEKTEEKLLRHFKSLAKLKAATKEEVSELVGKSLADRFEEAKKKGAI